MNIKMLNWKRPLFYCILPLLFLLVFIGVLPTFPPPPATKSAQEQSVPGEEEPGES
jgi:hypothetical protein